MKPRTSLMKPRASLSQVEPKEHGWKSPGTEETGGAQKNWSGRAQLAKRQVNGREGETMRDWTIHLEGRSKTLVIGVTNKKTTSDYDQSRGDSEVSYLPSK